MKTGLSADELKKKAASIARTLVRSHGYERFRLSDVAKEMNISHAALYKYFKNKDELLDTVNATWLAEIDAKLAQIAYRDTTPGNERLVQWFTTLYTMKREKVQADVEPYSALVAATADQKDFVRDHLSVQFDQLRYIVSETYPDLDKTETTQLILTATLSYHYPKFVQDTADVDMTRELVSLLSVLDRGLSPSSRAVRDEC